jgi:hypothetical protein
VIGAIDCTVAVVDYRSAGPAQPGPG